jgi:hypothetical protein
MTVDLSQLITAEARRDADEAHDVAAQLAVSQAYLADTDWYVTRKVETGKAIPEEILAARNAAREGRQPL